MNWPPVWYECCHMFWVGIIFQYRYFSEIQRPRKAFRSIISKFYNQEWRTRLIILNLPLFSEYFSLKKLSSPHIVWISQKLWTEPSWRFKLAGGTRSVGGARQELQKRPDSQREVTQNNLPWLKVETRILCILNFDGLPYFEDKRGFAEYISRMV
jgi:hypothetical protein